MVYRGIDQDMSRVYGTRWFQLSCVVFLVTLVPATFAFRIGLVGGLLAAFCGVLLTRSHFRIQAL